MLKRNSITSIISAVNKEDVETKFKAQLYSGENENGMKRYVVSLTVYSKTDVWDNIEVMHDIVYNFHTLKHNPQESDETWNLILTQEEVDVIFHNMLQDAVNKEVETMLQYFNKNIVSALYSKVIGKINNLDEDSIEEYGRYILNSNSKDRINKIVANRRGKK
jgi:hypothetical protein